MNKSPLVSVIVITYAHENFILDTIKSILCQDYDGDIELIISNDASPDKTDQIIVDFLKVAHVPDNIKVNYINQSINLGIRSNFLFALNLAKGEFIALCEGDDYWIDSLKLAKQVQFLKNNDDYVIHSGRVYELLDNGDKKVAGNFYKKESYSIEDFYVTNNLFTCTVLFRNNLSYFHDFQEAYFLDWLLYVNILFQNPGKKAYCSNDILAYYRIHDGGAMRALNTDYKNTLFVYNHIVVINRFINPLYSNRQFNRITEHVILLFRYYYQKREIVSILKTFRSFLSMVEIRFIFKKIYIKLLGKTKEGYY